MPFLLLFCFTCEKNKSTPTLKEVGKKHEQESNLPHASKIIAFVPFVCFIEALKKHSIS